MKVWVIAAVLFLDQLAKYLAVEYLEKSDKPIPLIPGFISLQYRPNLGAAFSMFSGQTFALSILTVAAIVVIGWIAAKTPRDHPWARWGYSLILGGAAGNLLDRLFRGGNGLFRGHVVDFMQFPWFVNNLADDAICIGVACVVLAFYLYPQSTPPVAADVGDETRGAGDSGTGGGKT